MPAKGTSSARKVRPYKPEVDYPLAYRTYCRLKTELAVTTNIVDLSVMPLAVLLGGIRHCGDGSEYTGGPRCPFRREQERAVSDLLVAAATYFAEKGWPVAQHDSLPVLRLEYEGAHGTWPCFVKIDEALPPGLRYLRPAGHGRR